jgi:hypothetical protein
LGWPPSEFWEATFFDYSNAYVGYMKSNAIGPWADKSQSGRDFRPDEVESLKSAIEKEREHNPDGPVKKDSIKEAIREKKRLNRERRDD